MIKQAMLDWLYAYAQAQPAPCPKREARWLAVHRPEKN